MKKFFIILLLLSTLLSCSNNNLTFNGSDFTKYELDSYFELTSHKGKEKNINDFKGKVIAIFFGFVSCPDICPTTMLELKNIKSIDIQSYSDLIELADMLKMPYEDNSFDLVIIGYVITYTNEPQKAIDEVVRVLKDKGIVTMCHSHALEFPQKGYSKVHINSSKVMLDFFGNNLDYVYFKYHPFDDKSENRNYGRSNYLLRVKK